jgi:hypothetical protein
MKYVLEDIKIREEVEDLLLDLVSEIFFNDISERYPEKERIRLEGI